MSRAELTADARRAVEACSPAAGAGALYFALGASSVWLERALSSTASLLPADAVAIALICRDPRAWGGKLVAIALAAATIQAVLGTANFAASAAAATAHVSAAATSVLILRELLGIRGANLTPTSATLGFVGGGVVPAGVGALVVGAAAALLDTRAAWPAMLDWWRMQVLMFAVCVPPILLWSREAARKLVAREHLAANGLGLLSCLVACVLILELIPFPFVALSAPLLLIAFRTNPLATALAGAVVAAEVIVCWLIGIRPPQTPLVEGDALRSFPLTALACTILPPVTLALSVKERRTAARALRDSREETRSVVENSPIGIGVMRIGEASVHANPALLRLLGRTSGPGRAIPLSSLVHAEDLAANEGMFRSIRDGEAAIGRGSFRYTRADGSVIWVQSAMTLQRDAHGEPAKWIVYAESLEERLANERQLLEERERFRTTLEAVSDAVLTTDAAGVVLHANSAAYRMLGQRREEVVGKPIDSVLALTRESRTRPIASMLRQAMARADGAARAEPVLLHRPDGAVLYVRDSATPIRRQGGLIAGWVIVVGDVTASHVRDADVRRRADHDALTGLANRFLFEQRLQQIAWRNRHVGQSAALLMIDLDRFKAVNDRGGHAVGDRVLREVAMALTSVVRAADLACRIGGDEFAVILVGCSLEDAQRIGERLATTIGSRVISVDGEDFSVGASIGIAMLPQGEVDAAAWVASADRACYRAKNDGGGCMFLKDGTHS